MSIKLIDFSEGIKAEELNHNFKALQEQINRERRNVGGSGVASGLEITPIVNANEFAIEVSEASIISNTGEEIHIPKRKINIELPKLAKEIEYLTCNASNQVTLKHIPYSLNRRSSVETSNIFTPDICGITIKYRDSIAQDDYIRVRAINERTVSLSGITKRDVIITYNYTGKRIDTVYIDKNDELKIISSTTSPTPSLMLPSDYKYLIAFLEVDGLYRDNNNQLYANIEVREDLRNIRNIYTDETGELWLCGTPFKDLQVIHLVEPINPKENTMWYDSFTNQLKVWKATDKLIYMNRYTVTTDYANNIDALKDYPTDMYYYVGKNQLEIYINDIKLDDSQFAELVNGTPASIQVLKDGVMSNTFRILTDLNLGDKITYKITNFDSHEMWVPVNHSSYVNAKDIKMFSPDSEEGATNYFATEKAIALGKDENRYPYKYQYFIFDKTKDLNMLFTPGKHELSLMVNQVPLHSDQFEEITVYDLFSGLFPETVVEAMRNYFGWDAITLENMNNDYENTGIGFKLKQPLDVDLAEEDNGATDLYVEAIVERRVNDGPLKRKLQRSATFSTERTITLEDNQLDITIDEGYYRYDENQLEVYIDGIRLIKDIDFFEGTDLNPDNIVDEDGNVTSLPQRRKGARSKQFSLAIARPNSKLTYRATTSIYSYDHITDLLEDMDYNAQTAVKQVEELYDKTVNMQETLDSNLSRLEREIQEVKDISDKLDENYLTRDDVLTESQMPPTMVNNSIQSLNHIMTSITYQSGTNNYSIKQDCREEDFIVAIKRNISNQIDKLLIRGVDYNIYNTFNSSQSYEDTIFALSESAATLTNTGDIIILTGLKIGKVGR